MNNPFRIGAQKQFSKIVQPNEKAEFDNGVVHAIYSTFFLTKDAEWSTRLFVLDMKEEDEEGIGTFIYVDHLSPARIGSTVDFTATLEEVNGHEIVCTFEAKVGDRIIARGKTGQKILKKEKLDRLLNNLPQ